MSTLDDGEDYGPVHASLSPPIDALATVAVGGDAVTTVEVPSGSTLRVHLKERGRAPDSWDDYGAAEGREADADVPEDVHASAEVCVGSWVTVTVDDERRVRCSAVAGDVVTIHAEVA